MRPPRKGRGELGVASNCKWSLGVLPAAGGMGPKWPAMPTEPLRIELNMIMQVGEQDDDDEDDDDDDCAISDFASS